MNYICGPLWDRRIVNIDQQGKVGIVMSGGLDSYVLYHLLDDPIVFNIKREVGWISSIKLMEEMKLLLILVCFFIKVIK